MSYKGLYTVLWINIPSIIIHFFCQWLTFRVMCLVTNRNLLYLCVRKREEEILQKPFQKGRHSKVAHRSLHSNELDRYWTSAVKYTSRLYLWHFIQSNGNIIGNLGVYDVRQNWNERNPILIFMSKNISLPPTYVTIQRRCVFLFIYLCIHHINSNATRIPLCYKDFLSHHCSHFWFMFLKQIKGTLVRPRYLIQKWKGSFLLVQWQVI